MPQTQSGLAGLFLPSRHSEHWQPSMSAIGVPHVHGMSAVLGDLHDMGRVASSATITNRTVFIGVDEPRGALNSGRGEAR